ncbi:MAG: hypothetical protein L6Q81_13630, partial [Bacteroidia bacterium]|nr:hypothetical protein [Bacteroidia bacterium]
QYSFRILQFVDQQDEIAIWQTYTNVPNEDGCRFQSKKVVVEDHTCKRQVPEADIYLHKKYVMLTMPTDVLRKRVRSAQFPTQS